MSQGQQTEPQTEQQTGGFLSTGLQELRRQKLEGGNSLHPAHSSTTTPPSGAPQEVQMDVDGDPSFLGTVKDTLFGLASGPAKAVDEVLDLEWGVRNFVREGTFREPTPEERANLPRFHRIEPDTQAGKIAQSVTQFVSGFVTTGTAMKAARILQGTSGMAGIARPMVQGAITDFATLDAHEERLSNLVEQYPSLRGPITAYLAADKDDSMLEGRFKGMLEGAIGGVGADALVAVLAKGLKMLKGLRKASSQDEAIKLLDEVAPSSSGTATTADVAPVEGAAGKEILPKASPTPAKPTSPYTPNILPSEQIKRMVDKAADATEVITDVVYNVNLNKMVFQSPQGSHVLKQMNDALADKTLKAAGPEKHLTILKDSLQDLQEHGIDYTEALSHAGDDPKALHVITRRVLSHRNVLHTMTTEASRLSAIIDEGRASLVEKAQFVMLSKNLQEMHLSLADMRTELGRALSSLNMKVDGSLTEEAVGEGDTFLNKWFGSEGMTNDEAAQWLAKEGWTSNNLKKLARDVQLMDGNSAGINKSLKESNSASLWGMITEMRINGLLSGAMTWAANGVGNLLKTVVMPTEKIIGGILLQDKAAIRAGTQTYVGLSRYLGDSFAMMYKAFKVGDNILDAKAGIMETPSHQITYDNIRSMMLKNKGEGAELSPIQEILARSAGYMGTAFRVPSHIMIATDELFKQLNFRADMYAKLYGDAVDKAGLKNSADIAEYIESNMRKAFSPEGSVAKGTLTADSLMYAQRSTWTQALEQGTLGNWVQTGASKHPLVRLLIPFVKTPTNIIRDFWQHTAAAPLYRECREAYAKGGEERARVVGQVALGQITAMTGVGLALSGHITGSPPKDAKLRKALEATGWEPYSIKIGDKYVSYRRIDPVGMFLGQAADTVAILTGRDDLTEVETNDIVIGLLASVVNNITSKTYMQGISETINAIQNPERYGESYIGRMASTFVPYSSMLRTVRKETDPHMREMDKVMDYVKNTVPGMSDPLPARRHWVTGDIIDYRLIGQDKNDIVLDELQRLGRSVVGAPTKTLGGVKLSAAQYSRLNELHGTVKVQGMTLHQTLEKLFNSPNYDIERNRLGDAPDGLESPRSHYVNRWIERFRTEAQRALRREDPTLRAAINEEYRNKKLAKRGAVTKEKPQGVLQQFTRLF